MTTIGDDKIGIGFDVPHGAILRILAVASILSPCPRPLFFVGRGPWTPTEAPRGGSLARCGGDADRGFAVCWPSTGAGEGRRGERLASGVAVFRCCVSADSGQVSQKQLHCTRVYASYNKVVCCIVVGGVGATGRTGQVRTDQMFRRQVMILDLEGVLGWFVFV